MNLVFQLIELLQIESQWEQEWWLINLIIISKIKDNKSENKLLMKKHFQKEAIQMNLILKNL